MLKLHWLKSTFARKLTDSFKDPKTLLSKESKRLIISILLILVLIICLIICIKINIIKISAVMEGVIIGVVSGLIISFITDANFQARIYGPVIGLARKMNKNWKYVSKNWKNIKYTRVDSNAYDIRATNIVSGVTVTFEGDPKTKLPPDLYYDMITSSDVTSTDAANIVGGVTVTSNIK